MSDVVVDEFAVRNNFKAKVSLNTIKSLHFYVGCRA